MAQFNLKSVAGNLAEEPGTRKPDDKGAAVVTMISASAVPWADPVGGSSADFFWQHQYLELSRV